MGAQHCHLNRKCRENGTGGGSRGFSLTPSGGRSFVCLHRSLHLSTPVRPWPPPETDELLNLFKPIPPATVSPCCLVGTSLSWRLKQNGYFDDRRIPLPPPPYLPPSFRLPPPPSSPPRSRPPLSMPFSLAFCSPLFSITFPLSCTFYPYGIASPFAGVSGFPLGRLRFQTARIRVFSPPTHSFPFCEVSVFLFASDSSALRFCMLSLSQCWRFPPKALFRAGIPHGSMP